MCRRNDLAHRKIGDGRERVRLELERGRAGPGTFDDDVFETIIDELEDAGAAVDMGDDLEQIVWLAQLHAHAFEIESLVLEANGSSGDADRAVIKCSDKSVFFGHQAMSV